MGPESGLQTGPSSPPVPHYVPYRVGCTPTVYNILYKNKKDCRSLWRRKTTKMGACIEFDPSHAVKTYNKTLEATMVKDMAFELGDNQLRTLAILIGLNGSDFTYG